MMKIGIAGKLVLALGLCALLVLGVTGLMEYHAGRLIITHEVEARLDGISNRLSLTLRRSVYEFDQESVRDTLLAEFPEQGLEAAAVWTHDRQRLLAGLARGEDGRIVDVKSLPQGKSFIERQMSLHLSASDTPAGQVAVGEFALVFDQRYLEQRLLREILVRQAKSALTVLLLLLLLGEVVRRSLVKPLEELHRAMAQAEANAFDVASPAATVQTNSQAFMEMQQMAGAFNRLLETVTYRQTALAVSEERYRELIENADALVLKLDAELSCMYVNRASEVLFACPTAECIGRSLIDFIHPEERAKTREILENWVAGQDGHVHLDTRLARQSGESVHVAWSFSVAHDYSGEPIYFRAIGQDVTRQRSAEQQIRDSEASYRRLSQEFEAVLEGIADSLVLFNSQLEVVWANRGASDQFGLAREQIRGRTCHQLWTGDAGGDCTDCVHTVFATGNAFEGVHSTADGRTWGVKGYPIFDGSRQVSNVIQIASDLTEKMTLREEATRATHLAALGSLSAGVAHEINNPTGLILMSVPVVQAVFDDILNYLDEHPGEHETKNFGGLPFALVREEIPQNLFDILGGAQRIRAIVEDLKNFARQEVQGTHELVDLGEVVNRALRLLGNLIKNSTQFFVLEVAADLPRVTGSAQRLEQVVVNLLQNACHALTSSEQAVEVKVTANLARRLVVLQVHDEGVGIPAEIREKITDPFFTTRREAGGTGLGLSVSARIISEHGGVLKIDSEPGHGSTFTVELPIQEEGKNGD